MAYEGPAAATVPLIVGDAVAAYYRAPTAVCAATLALESYAEGLVMVAGTAAATTELIEGSAVGLEFPAGDAAAVMDPFIAGAVGDFNAPIFTATAAATVALIEGAVSGDHVEYADLVNGEMTGFFAPAPLRHFYVNIGSRRHMVGGR